MEDGFGAFTGWLEMTCLDVVAALPVNVLGSSGNGNRREKGCQRLRGQLASWCRWYRSTLLLLEAIA